MYETTPSVGKTPIDAAGFGCVESGTRAEAAHAEHTARASEAREGAQATRAPQMHKVQHAHSAPEPIERKFL